MTTCRQSPQLVQSTSRLPEPRIVTPSSNLNTTKRTLDQTPRRLASTIPNSGNVARGATRGLTPTETLRGDASEHLLVARCVSDEADAQRLRELLNVLRWVPQEIDNQR